MGIIGRAIRPLIRNPFLTFSSPTSFTLSVIGSVKLWNGTVQYSTDMSNWNVWNGTTTINSGAIGGKHYIFVRGINNTYLTGSTAESDRGAWHFTGSNISIRGNIHTLLDYATVALGGIPTVGTYAYYRLFGWKDPGNYSITDAGNLIIPDPLTSHCCDAMFGRCKGLASFPPLPSMNLADYCYYAMFYACEAMIIPPELPALVLHESCYENMFMNCTGLTTVPALHATTVASKCYKQMFQNDTSLTTLPALYALTLQSECYRNMFYGCKAIKAATSSSSTYKNEYRVPWTGTGTTASNALTYFFQQTGGSFAGAPTINRTYYVQNEIVL